MQATSCNIGILESIVLGLKKLPGDYIRMFNTLTKPFWKNLLTLQAFCFFSLNSNGKNPKFKINIILVTILFLSSGCALHKDVVTLNNRIGELRLRVVTLENDIPKLNKKMEGIKNIENEKEKTIRGQTAGQYAEIERHREEIQKLNGRIEELEHLSKQKLSSFAENDKKTENRLARIEETAVANNNKIVRLEQYLSLEGKEKAANPLPAAAADQKKELTEDDMYAVALKLYDSEKYTAAREKLQEIMKKFPNSDKSDNCQFWIGESYYQEKWYEKAIVEYQKVIEKYPKGNKVKSSLLKQGLSFYNLGDKKNSKLILNELIDKFPDSNEAKIAAAKLKGF